MATAMRVRAFAFLKDEAGNLGGSAADAADASGYDGDIRIRR